jgi:Flp pilus assembly CpaE family ATPase
VRSIGVAVAHSDPRVVDELVHDVEASADLYLALDPGSAAVVVAGEPGLRAYAEQPPPAGTGLVALSIDGDLTRVARAALSCGALDVLRWPEDRTSLRSTLRDAAARASLRAAGTNGRVVAVVGARGGAGATTIAAMLGASIPDAVVADLDRVGAGQHAFASPDAEPMLDEVLAAAGDLDPPAFSSALVAHASGRALCGRPRSAPATADQIASLLSLLRATVPIAVCDGGRAGDDAGRVLLTRADALVCVCAGDVASMRGALALGSASARPMSVVLNAAERSRLRPRDVARALGTPPACIVPFDPVVRRAGEAGRLPSRGHARRTVLRFGGQLSEELAGGS